jgi:Fe-S-cluster-containing dehydrogenase component
MSKWNLIFDVERCNSCNNCVLATKDEYLFNRFEGYSEPAPRLGNLWLDLKRKERGAAPMMDVSHYLVACQQCDNAPCISAKTEGVVSKRADGIVVIDPVAGKGHKDIVETCPYGQIFWNEKEDLPQKWSFDAHLIDGGRKEPRCATVCPTGAIETVRIDDAAMQARAEAENLQQLRPELGTKPRIWYRHFDRINSLFLGGTVVRIKDGIEDCVEGLEVRLSHGGEIVSVIRTDAFGDFKFEPLSAGDYQIEVLDEVGNCVAQMTAPLSTSGHIGIMEIPALDKQ